MKPWISLATAFALTASLTATAQNSTNPVIGTWTLNVAKSKYSVPGTAPKSETRTYEMAPDGMIRQTAQVTAADGNSHTEDMTFKRDGKPYAITGNSSADALAITHISSEPWEDRTTLLRGGKVIGNLTFVISKDGKVLTMTTTITTPSGQTQNNVRVYDRQ